MGTRCLAEAGDGSVSGVMGEYPGALVMYAED